MKSIYWGIALLMTLSACRQTPGQQENLQTMDTSKKMNETIETIMNRRSIRSYKPEQITPEELDVLLACAVHAPSALNKQPWEIRVVRNPDLLKTINDGFIAFAKGRSMQGSASRAQEPGFSVFHGAPTVIVVANDTANGSSQVDCGLMGQNILLAAEAQGIGTCVIGGVIGFLNTPEGEEIVSSLHLPDGYKPLYTIAVGYKAEEQPEAKPRDISKISVIE